MPARSPLDHLRLLRGGLDAHGEAVPLGQEQPVSTRARKQPALEVFGQVEGVAHGADGRRVLLKQELEQGKMITVTVSFTDAANNAETLTSAATAAVAAKPNTPATGAPTITGTAQVGQTLTAATSGISDADGLGTFSYQWIRVDSGADADISGATSSTYTLVAADQGKTIKVKVSFTDDAGNEESLTSAATAAAEPQANTPATGAPAITGAARVGETLAANTSGIADEDGLENAVFSYQWLADGADISGATDSTYLPVVDDAGRAIGVRVSFTDDDGNEETLTGAAGTVPADDYTVNEIWETGNWGRVTVGGSATGVVEKPGDRDFFGVNLSRGRTYRIDVAGHGDVGALEQVRLYGVFVYAEDLECSGAYDDPGVTIYVLTAEHSAPHSVAVRAEGDGTGVYRVSVSEPDDTGTGCDTAPVAAAQAANTPATGAPVITGTVRVGETVTAGTSVIADEDCLSNAVYSYQWQADGAEISSATGSAYTLAGADKGKAISVKVSFSDDTGNAETLTSEPTGAVEAKPNSPATGAPAVTGTAKVGETLTVDTSGIADADGLDNVSFTYQWLAGDADIQDATASTYTPVVDDMGKAISVTVSFTDDAGHEETLTSAATAAVEARPNRSATGALTIIGTARVGELLTADVSEIADADGLDKAAFAYQWQADSTDLSGATDSSYTLATSDEGKAISVTVTFTDYAGHEESFTSTPTAAVVAATDDDTAEPTDRPHGLTAEASDGAVVLTWTAPVVDYEVSSYHILRHRPEQGEAEPLVYVNQTPNKDTSYTDTDVEAGVLYVYRVKAIMNWMGDLGDASDAAQIRVQATAQEQTANNPATGAPTITGTVQVGEKLTADTSGIEDVDGLENASFSYQWLADGADISSATGSSYTLVDSDEGKAVSVTVSFTDDTGNDETLTSAATAAVAAVPLPQLTAVIENAAASHDGENVFTFELRFSEEFGISYKTLRDHAFTVTGGTVRKAQRLEQGSNIGWRITVRPNSDGQVTITLPITEDCDAQGAICTEDGRMLSTELELTVSGP